MNFHLDFPHHFTQGDRIEAMLRAILANQEHTVATTDDIKADTATLIASVAAETNALTAVTTYVTGLKAQLTDVEQQLATALANGADPTVLGDIHSQLQTVIQSVNANEVADAALTNTPGPAPVVPPAPPTPPASNGAVPTVIAITPDTGHAAGGDSVTITGAGFSTITGVTFGGVAAPSISPNHDTSLAVTTPPGTGTVDVVVTNSAGDSAATPFTYA